MFFGRNFYMARKLTTALAALALLIAFLVFATHAHAGSFDNHPPRAMLFKYKTKLQESGAAAGRWNWREDGGWGYVIYDSFGFFHFPEVDEVAAGRRLHVRFDKPERPNYVEVKAWPKTKKDPRFGGEYFAGKGRELGRTLEPVKRDGETVGWDVFFRVGQKDRDYYLRVSSGWHKEPHSHASYGRVAYPLHVKTR
jgi:hypothetical protein